ncbi:MAG: hypothetical protein K1W28_08280, partial [Lachnospiraceae bacterium]
RPAVWKYFSSLRSKKSFRGCFRADAVFIEVPHLPSLRPAVWKYFSSLRSKKSFRGCFRADAVFY